jgi:hypothetical protein
MSNTNIDNYITKIIHKYFNKKKINIYYVNSLTPNTTIETADIIYIDNYEETTFLKFYKKKSILLKVPHTFDFNKFLHIIKNKEVDVYSKRGLSYYLIYIF